MDFCCSHSGVEQDHSCSMIRRVRNNKQKVHYADREHSDEEEEEDSYEEEQEEEEESSDYIESS